uniref:Glycosyltransferase n=1 Tax=Polygala tenuifolia TaxID=355332 RepID=A0A3G3NBV7_9FABA|nr:UDP-glucosyltransferase UGT73BB1 [Polygala tenuifolia]
MDSHDSQLHISFFPFMGPGHMLPTIDIAKLFAFRGLKVTIITTPSNAAVDSTLQKTKELGFEIKLLFIKFPYAELGLPEGCDAKLMFQPQLRRKLCKIIPSMQHSLEELLQQHRPACLVADTIFPWATDAAKKYGIPRFVFHGSCFFSVCASICLYKHKPHHKAISDSEPFLIPDLPDEIKLSKNQLPDYIKQEEVDEIIYAFYKSALEAEFTSDGAIVNSFYELEPAYADHYTKLTGRRGWHIGPVSLCNEDFDEKAQRGNEAGNNQNKYCLRWLDSKPPSSVIYVCFGSMTNFSDSQLMEIAAGLEASGQHFIWVVKKEKEDKGNGKWLPEGLEKRVEEKGLIIRGWAPQLLILNHVAVGGFVTHCGWNSTLEGVAAGLPMVTWPVSAEQFYNEKLIIQVLKIGVSVGAQKWIRVFGDYVKKEAIAKAVTRIVIGEEAEGMRKRARALADKSKAAVTEGGSSHNELNHLIQELKALRTEKLMLQ